VFLCFCVYVSMRSVFLRGRQLMNRGFNEGLCQTQRLRHSGRLLCRLFGETDWLFPPEPFFHPSGNILRVQDPDEGVYPSELSTRRSNIFFWRTKSYFRLKKQK
jgi:hypothetical protein